MATHKVVKQRRVAQSAEKAILATRSVDPEDSIAQLEVPAFRRHLTSLSRLGIA